MFKGEPAAKEACALFLKNIFIILFKMKIWTGFLSKTYSLPCSSF